MTVFATSVFVYNYPSKWFSCEKTFFVDILCSYVVLYLYHFLAYSHLHVE